MIYIIESKVLNLIKTDICEESIEFHESESDEDAVFGENSKLSTSNSANSPLEIFCWAAWSSS